MRLSRFALVAALLCTSHLFPVNLTVVASDERHAESRSRRLLYEPDGAMRSRHHRLFNSCWSVHERRYYQPASSARTPMTEELAERLKAYAERQARCINGVKDWPDFLSNPAKGLQVGVDASSVQECSYLYHLDPAYSGLGNQLLSLVSSFTFALLTNRTLIINPHAQAALFLCDPFAFTPTPSTWMPMDSPTFAASEADLAFFCPHHQEHPHGSLSSVRILGLLTDAYLLPALYHAPHLQAELERLFPDRLPLMHVGRYLLHPANYIWEEITRAFRAYLAPHQHRVGIQIREFQKYVPADDVLQRVVDCVVNVTKAVGPIMAHEDWEKLTKQPPPSNASLLSHVLGEQDLLMGQRNETEREEQAKAEEGEKKEGEKGDEKKEVEGTEMLGNRVDGGGGGGGAEVERVAGAEGRRKGGSVGVFVASLRAAYGEMLREMSTEGRPEGGQEIAVSMLSHEGAQQLREKKQAERALREMWLLSMCDTLLITDTSTFGYIAAGLAGVRPFSLNIVARYHSDWRKNNRTSCSRTSPEPCYLSIFDVKSRHIQCPNVSPVTTPAAVSSLVESCPNFSMGLSIVQRGTQDSPS
ncbi:unnamed protein product [Closterium sp. Yama58-4]|nr:unnamed protein product [Closterium sp. Yama58-4]